MLPHIHVLLQTNGKVAGDGLNVLVFSSLYEVLDLVKDELELICRRERDDETRLEQLPKSKKIINLDVITYRDSNAC